MEQKPLPIGIDNFEKLITRGYYFVDKTLLIKDLLDNKAVIIEMKVCDKPKELFTKPQDALQQIEDKKYEYELNESGYEDIIKYGMAFYRKDCLIKIKE